MFLNGKVVVQALAPRVWGLGPEVVDDMVVARSKGVVCFSGVTTPHLSDKSYTALHIIPCVLFMIDIFPRQAPNYVNQYLDQ